MTGAGGIGKTRLALHVASTLLDTFEDGVAFVPLASISDPAFVLPAMVQALDLQDEGGTPPLDRLKAALWDRHCLVLLDNFEQVLPAAPQLIELLHACPQLTFLVTSRAVLHVSGEHEFPVPPLALPQLTHLPVKELLAHYEAVALFVERARAITPGFQLTEANASAIAEICVRLDGLPLALELAAARIKLFSPQTLLARLGKRLPLLTGGARDLPARQQTLRDTIRWSYDLLDAEAQHLFRWLAVFDGGCTLSAANAVCRSSAALTSDIVEGIAALIDQSLLRSQASEEGEPRLTMLETIREYGLECLGEKGEIEACVQAHAQYYLRLVHEADPHLKGEQQLFWFQRLDDEMANIFAALDAAFTIGMHAELVQGLNAFTPFLELRGLYAQAELHLKRAQQVATPLHDSIGLTDTLYHLGMIAHKQRNYTQAEAYLQESSALAKQLADPARISNALRSLGWVISRRGDYVQAAGCVQEALALAKQAGNQELIMHALITLGGIVNEQGDYALAERYSHEGLAIARQSGNRKRMCMLLANLAELAIPKGEYTQAEAYAQEALALANQIGFREGSAQCLSDLGQIMAGRGDYHEAERYSLEALALARQRGDRELTCEILTNLGRIAGEQANDAQARVYLEDALELARQIGNHWNITVALYEWGNLHLKQRRLDDAAAAFAEARGIAAEGDKEYLVLASYGLARVAAAYGDVSAARQQGQESLALLVAMGHGKAQAVRQWLETISESVPVLQPVASVVTPPAPTYPAGLTAREVEVLRLVAQGLTNPQIADRLIISLHTVNAHVRSIFNKVDVNSRTALARFAIEHHLL